MAWRWRPQRRGGEREVSGDFGHITDQREESQFSSNSSVRHTGRLGSPAEEFGGSVARRASILARVLISA